MLGVVLAFVLMFIPNYLDAVGISPDVRIDLPLPARLTDIIDEWVIWVAEQLEK